MRLVHNRPGQGFSETLAEVVEYALRIHCRLQKAALGIGGDKSNFHGLAAHTDRKGKIRCGDRLLTDIDKAFPDFSQPAKKKHALKPPVRKINNIVIISGRVGQYISKKIIGYQVGIDTAELAGKQAVCLLQYGRCPALGALMFNEKIYDSLQMKKLKIED